MTEKEMTNRVNEILDCIFTDRNANTYGELMAAAYNLWTFLRYDANCEYPAFVSPTEGKFEF